MTGLGHLPWYQLAPLIGLPAFWLLCFALYCVRVALRGRDRTERLDKLAAGPWMPRLLLEFGYYMYRAPVRACVVAGISANALTASSVVLTIVAAVAIGLGYPSLGGWTLLLAFTCDGMDGVVARATGTSSDRGEFLDAIADHYGDLIAGCGYLYYYRNDVVPALLVIGAMIGSSVVSYSRAKGEALGVDPNVGYMRRFERTVWLGGGTVLAPLVAAYVEPGAAHPRYHVIIGVMALLTVLTNLTVLRRVRFVLAGLRALGR